ncbi:MAG: ABC transporter permease [Gemmatimonadota bacterium]|nr:ABC transporter permease [Gemmatimonadota bacterium]
MPFGHKRVFRFPWRTDNDVTQDISDELQFHLDMRTEELVNSGLSPAMAREQTLRDFGDLEYTKRYCATVDRGAERRSRRIELMHDFRQDATYAWRKLRKSPGFTLIVALTLALGIGANTAIFSVVNAVLLRSLPYEDPDRLVRVISTRRGKNSAASYSDFIDFRAQNRSLAGIAALADEPMHLTAVGADPMRVTAARVSANIFSVMGVHAQLGRSFAPDEDLPTARKVVVLGDAIWRSRFNADRAIISRSITLDGNEYTVVGVMPRGIEYPDDIQLWRPLTPEGMDTPDHRGAHYLETIGRLKPSSSYAAAEGELVAIAKRLEQQYPESNAGRGMRFRLLSDQIVGSTRKPLYVLLGAVGFVLLIACANVANLFLVRAASRGSEIAIRTALGAGRTRLVRQLVTESMLLSLFGGAAGVGLAWWGTAALVRLGPSIPRLSEVRIDGTVLAFTALITLATGFVFGLLPALQSSTPDLAGALRAGSRGTRTHHGSRRVRSAIVVTEVALAVMLLAGAGLLIQSFVHLQAVDPGFRPENVATFSIELPDKKYPDEKTQRAFASQLEERMRHLAGVNSAAIIAGRPFGNWDASTNLLVTGRPPLPPGQRPITHLRAATADYFKTMGIPIVRGRSFTDADRAGSHHVAIISQENARRYFPGEDPIGKSITTGFSNEEGDFGGEIVAIAGDVKDTGLDANVEPATYFPLDQAPMNGLSVVLRTTGNASSIFNAARAELHQIDPDMPLSDATTMEASVSSSVARPRFYTLLLGIFAAVALVLAGIGLYGVIAYAVSQRTHEIGIRIALGASRDAVLRMIVGQGLGLAVVGVGLGIILATIVTRVMSSLLFGVSATDPLTFAGVGVILLAISMLASAIPARRAARVDPVVALRE